MFIKLVVKAQTAKAYQLENGSWIPKSILDNRGLKPPFYKVKDWWIGSMFEKLQAGDATPKKAMIGIKNMVVEMRDMPKEVREYWSGYWKSASDELHSYNMEPRLWGNDCFDGEMSSWH